MHTVGYEGLHAGVGGVGVVGVDVSLHSSSSGYVWHTFSLYSQLFLLGVSIIPSGHPSVLGMHLPLSSSSTL